VGDAGLVTLYRVVVAAVGPDREEAVARVVGSIRGAKADTAPPTTLRLPVVVLRQATSKEAKEAAARLEEAGAEVRLESYRSPAPEARLRRATCPRCGSVRVKNNPFSGAGGVNARDTKCLDCGNLFRSSSRG
jgi:hypothetical protein